MRKILFHSLFLFAAITTLCGVAAAGPKGRDLRSDRRDIAGDTRDIRKDKRDTRNDRRDRRHDVRDLREDRNEPPR